MSPDEYLTPDEVAGRFRVSTQTVLNWIRAGRLQAIQLSPRVVRIPRSEVQRLESARRPLPKDLLAVLPWEEVLRVYEAHFGISTQEMLRLRTVGRTPRLATGDDERLYDAWVGTAEMAVAAGLLAVAGTSTTP